MGALNVSLNPLEKIETKTKKTWKAFLQQAVCVIKMAIVIGFLIRCGKGRPLDFSLFPVLDRGVGPGCNTREIAHKLIELKAEIEDLEHRERELEQQKMWVQQSIRNVTDDVQNKEYPWSLVWFFLLLGFLDAKTQVLSDDSALA